MKKTVLITGVSSGFGFYTAKLLAQSGYKVFGTVRKQKDLKVFTNLPLSIQPKTLILDITWPQDKITQTVKKIIKKTGKINCLVNNAGYAHMGCVGSFTIEEVRQQFNVNLFGAFKMIFAVLPHMRKQQQGLIINVNSIFGLTTTAFYGIYSASKFALEALTQSLRVEESIFNVNAVSINPGSFKTNSKKNTYYPDCKHLSSKSKIRKLNNKFKKITSKLNRHQGPERVAVQIKKVIETHNPKNNYLVGYDAKILYLVHKILPTSIQNWLIKKFIKRLA
ncbi:SDR family NAD(P)-dependent oxidoreductase [Patescibacteria group bacterium]|nr:SDR family NAD(P)-dependent oxidoreductase [Patescibacteria group bacterium]